ncbi:hypothetical protein WR25_00705 [Diploscapter pachys]|uniref:Uncharacterized protein n=1 Tax=Diploscapter pachys TaxID=2018661 RepID=A0A2A2M552_9BILA|nr:hypothetical protein WR25_00705 [Diploscapter pachys]
MVAAPDEMHDLDIVAILDAHVLQRRARHDLQVPLHRDLLRHQPQLVRQIGEAETGGDALVLAVHGDRYGAVAMGHDASNSLCVPHLGA